MFKSRARRTARSACSAPSVLGIEQLEDRRLLAAYDVLVFTEAAGFVHGSIDEGVAAVQALGAANDFTVTESDDSSIFTSPELAQYEAVVFMNTSGVVMSDTELAGLLAFVRDGGGFVGVHAAADTQRNSPEYLELVGAEFWTHPSQQGATILVEDRTHASTAHMPDSWYLYEEWYDFLTNPRGDVQVLMSLDTDSYSGHVMGHDHPISWYQYIDGGRSWYTGLGHREQTYQNSMFLEHLLGGIEFAAGFAPADHGAGVDANYEKVVIEEDVNSPVSLDIASDGRVFFVEIQGKVRVWDPVAGSTHVAAIFAVDQGGEDGLLGIALDPDFQDNGWVYLFYTPETPEGAEQMQRVSRFTYVGTLLDRQSEKVLLEWPTIHGTSHTAGSLAFGPDGTLYISNGDDTHPNFSDGYAPIDERPGEEFKDAQRSSANNNDLRGSILRIKPEDDGTYSIPEGNLFPADGSAGRPEIFVMGVRNPFRISVDQENGWLYWGDVGPDAYFGEGARGPRGYDEINQARGAGNYGWPYFIGDNIPYRDYDFETEESGSFFDPNNVVNDSPNNTGSTQLPDAQPAIIWYPYGESTEFPELGEAGIRVAATGPVYHFDSALDSEFKLPESLDGSLIMYDWGRQSFWQVILDTSGDILKINPLFEGLDFFRPIDAELGPDGALYVIEWGGGISGSGPEAKIVRIEYTGALPSILGDYNDDGLVDAADYTIWRDAEGTIGQSPADGDRNGVVNRADYLLWANHLSPPVYPMAGDYNGDRRVDAADYTVWRDQEGLVGDYAADGNRDGVVDYADQLLWQANYGLGFMLDVLPGDYNRDGVVDLADYTVWRDNEGTTGPLGDGDSDGAVGHADYVIWQENFGRTVDSVRASGDYNGDGSVDLNDFLVWSNSEGFAGVSRADGNGDLVVDQLDHAIWAQAYEESQPVLAALSAGSSPLHTDPATNLSESQQPAIEEALFTAALDWAFALETRTNPLAVRWDSSSPRPLFAGPQARMRSLLLNQEAAAQPARVALDSVTELDRDSGRVRDQSDHEPEDVAGGTDRRLWGYGALVAWLQRGL